MNSSSTGDAGRRAAGTDLATALLRPDSYPHPVVSVRLIETHISWVLLTGLWAYKVKKPVNLGFLDFTTLESRRHFCEEELRLNRRFAPRMYESVVKICGTAQHPRIEGAGPVLEYAVKMREFPQEALASEMLTRGALTERHVDLLAQGVAEVHEHAARADPASMFGMPDAVLKPALDNFQALERCLSGHAGGDALRALRNWTQRECTARETAFAARRENGFVRECHGDLHLRNIAVLEGELVPFDCIEFDDRLRWIDVMSEIAFVVMDFEDRHRPDLAWRFLSRYLEATGDYRGLELLRFYAAYRALVRAKVHALRARQPQVEASERLRLDAVVQEYLALASRYAAPGEPALLITHGLSGSGKTTATQSLLERIGAVRVRSDIERKRLRGLPALARTGSAPDAGLYTKESTAATYNELQSLARSVIEAGYSAIVDAAFLRRTERDAFRTLAATLRVPFLILAFDAAQAVLTERVTQRLRSGADASEADLAVLQRQFEFREPLGPDETPMTLHIETDAPPVRVWEQVIRRLSMNRNTASTAP